MTAKRTPRVARHVSPGEYTDEESAWIEACERFKRQLKLRFLSHVEYLRLAKEMGYHKEAIMDSGMTQSDLECAYIISKFPEFEEQAKRENRTFIDVLHAWLKEQPEHGIRDQANKRRRIKDD